MKHLKLRKSIMRFADHMEFKLRRNDHKGGWSECGSLYLLKRLKEEVRELERAVKTNYQPLLITHEAADVANFAMMIANKTGALNYSLITGGKMPKPPQEPGNDN